MGQNRGRCRRSEWKKFQTESTKVTNTCIIGSRDLPVVVLRPSCSVESRGPPEIGPPERDQSRTGVATIGVRDGTKEMRIGHLGFSCVYNPHPLK
ncbi:hypothetical protein CsSME_00031608 [Camellia sinensis var. sinensis]